MVRGLRIAPAGVSLAVAGMFCASGAALAKGQAPENFNAALEAGFEVLTVIGQGADNQDHVIYMEKGDELIVCGFRFVLTDDGFDADKSRTLGVCTGFK